MTRSLVALVVAASAVAFAAGEPLTFGIAQPYGAEAAAKVPAVAEPYLSTALKGPVKVVTYPSAEELADALAAGKVDLAWITPLAFVRAQQKNSGVTALSKAMRQGQLFYRAVLFTRANASASSVAALKGKKVAYVSKTSTSGYLFVRSLLDEAHVITEGFFGNELFAGDHQAVCKAVKDGQADVGATFGNEPAEGKPVEATGCADVGPMSEWKVVASTGNVPNEVIAVRDFFPPTRVNDVIAAFGRMDGTPEGKKVLEVFRADSWGVAVEGDFAQVQALAKAMGARPSKDGKDPDTKPKSSAGKKTKK